MFTFSILRTLIWYVTFRVDQTVDHFVPVDTDSVIHKLRVELVFNYKWCTTSEHNFTQREVMFIYSAPIATEL